MNITFLDPYTIDRGDLDFSELEAMGDVRLLRLDEAGQAPELAKESNVLISNKFLITAELLDALPEVKLAVSAATGVNHIDLDACRDRDVAVYNVAGYSTPSVAQHTFALMLELATHVGKYNDKIRTDWPASPIFTRLDHPSFDLAGKTMGIVGLGAIGQAVAKIAQAMGMSVIAYKRGTALTPGSVAAYTTIPRFAEEDFFPRCDVVSLHCPLTEDNEKFLNETRFSLMKNTALLINTARGGLIDEVALANALREGSIGGAGLDVLSLEPPPADHPLLADDLKNIVITPHSAWSTAQARERLLSGIVEDIRAFQENRDTNRIV